MDCHYGHMSRILHWCTEQAMTNALAQMELTSAQGRVLAYLAHQQEPPCARDIEAEFQLSHPTVCGLLRRLETKGFLRLCPDPQDRRCKRIYVLPKGQQCHRLMHDTILSTESRMVSGFTPEEKERFSEFLQRAIINMGGGPCQQMNKEETDDNA